MPDIKVTLDWFDLDDLPVIKEYLDDYVLRFTHTGLHTGGICLDGYEGPTADGDLTLLLAEEIDHDDVPGLLAEVERTFGLDAPHTGGIGLIAVEWE